MWGCWGGLFGDDMMASPRPSSTRNLALLTALLIATALLPSKITGWITWLRGPFMTVVTPIAGPAAALGAWLRPPDTLVSPDATTPEAELLRQYEKLQLDYAVALERVGTLEALVRDLQEGVDFQPQIPISKIEAARVGSNIASGTIDVSRGDRDGVVVGAVAVARRSQQLVGIVTSSGPLVSTVHLITDPRVNPGLMVGVVMPARPPTSAHELAALPRIQLKPAGDGTLVMDQVGIGDAQRILPGQRVRLMDETWPAAASMLVLGQVIRIEPTDEPLFKRIVVKPEVDPARVSAMILNIPKETGAGRGRE